MTYREAILRTLSDLKEPVSSKKIVAHIWKQGYYPDSKGKTPDATISAWLTFLVTRERYKADGVARRQGKNKVYEYYLINNETDDTTVPIVSTHASILFYIQQYKKDFDRINDLEIYKWKAVKCFQDSWDIAANDFAKMLETAFEKTKSLLDSGNYFPLRMLIANARLTPDAVKQLFEALYKDEVDLKDRVEGFIKGIGKLNKNNFSGKKDYQDHRAVMVYLCMHSPEQYFLYKYTMFQQFSKLINYSYPPKRGRIENIFQYTQLCEQVKSLVEEDELLQRLHKQRIVKHPAAYAGDSINLLVQDIIYAATFHFKEVPPAVPVASIIGDIRIEHTPVEVVIKERKEPSFKGTIINQVAKQKRNKRIGNAGELFVLQQENKRLKSLKKKAEHVAITQGDGLGYDIKSYDVDGKEIYIEVKTTTQSFETPFFITRTELARSRVEGAQYRLYRVYDFDRDSGVGKIHISKGSLEGYCVEAETYRVGLRRVEKNDTYFSQISMK